MSMPAGASTSIEQSGRPASRFSAGDNHSDASSVNAHTGNLYFTRRYFVLRALASLRDITSRKGAETQRGISQNLTARSITVLVAPFY